jgi:hypothetical protein
MLGSPPASPPPPHPVRRDMIEKRRPAAMAVKGSGMRVVLVLPIFLGNCFLVKSPICCSTRMDAEFVDVQSIPCVTLSQKVTAETRARHMPQLVVEINRYILIIKWHLGCSEYLNCRI